MVIDQTTKGIATYLQKKGKWESIEILFYDYNKGNYFVEYSAKYFDGGGYCWTSKKDISISKEDLKPYIIHDRIIKVIIYYLKNDHPNGRGMNDIEICGVVDNGKEYLVEYQKKYFDGGGYRWTDNILSPIEKSDINSYLRNEKIDKIKDRV